MESSGLNDMTRRDTEFDTDKFERVSFFSWCWTNDLMAKLDLNLYLCFECRQTKNFIENFHWIEFEVFFLESRYFSSLAKTVQSIWNVKNLRL